MAVRAAPLMDYLRRLASARSLEPDADAVLLDRFTRRRDEDAFAQLVARHGPMVRGVCRRVLADPHLAEDASQAAFLVLARKAASIRPPDALAAWLHGVARRTALKARTAGARRRSREITMPELSPPDAHPGPPAELAARELLGAVDEEVQRLPQAYRLPVILCCLEGLSQEEAARRLGWTPGSVKGRLERGRARLHARLVRRGLTLAAAGAAVEAARNTATAAPLLLTGITAGVSARALTLARETVAGMAAAKLKAVTAAALLAVSLAAGGAWLLAAPKPASAPPLAHSAAPAPVVLSAPSGPAVQMEGKEETFCGLAFSPDGKRLAGGSHEGTVRVWDAATGAKLLSLQADGGIVRAVCFSHDGKLLAGACHKIRLWDARTGEAVRTLDRKLTVAPPFEAVAFSPDDTLVAGTAGGPDDEALLQAQADDNRYGVLVLWDAATGKEVRRLEGSGGGPVAFSPDGKRVAGAARDKTGHDAGVGAWDASTGKEVLLVHSGYASAVAFSPDGKRLAAGTDDGGLRVWDATNGKEVFTADHAYARRVVYVAFAGGGKYLVSAGQRKHQLGLFDPWAPEYDGEVQVWHAATGKEQFAFRTDVASVIAACLDPDGVRIAASPGASLEPVKIWSLLGDK